MATATKQTESKTIEAAAQRDDADTLQMVLAKTEEARANAERSRTEAEIKLNEMRTLAQVKMGPKGIQCDDLNGLWWLAKRYAEMENIPKQFRGRPADCLIAVEMGQRYGIHPKLFMEKCYVLHPGTDKEKRGIEAQLAIAMANNSGLLKGNIKYILDDEENPTKCEAWAIMADDGSRIRYTISVQDAKDAGWWEKKGRDGTDYSLWPKLTKLFLMYRSGTYLIRTNIPEVMLGMLTTEEIKDTDDAPSGMAPAAKQAASAAIQAENAKPAANRLSTVTDKLKNGNGKSNGHAPKPDPVPVEVAESQDAALTEEAITHAESHGGELPSDDSGPTELEMYCGEFPKPKYPENDTVSKEFDEALEPQETEEDIKNMGEHAKKRYGSKLTMPQKASLNAILEWHYGRVRAKAKDLAEK